MKKRLTVTPTKKQLIWGFIYLPVDMIVLPLLLSLGILLLQKHISFPITEGQFNGIYFAVNFLAVMLIFHRFLLTELRRCKGRMGSILKTAGLGFLIYMIANTFVSLIILNLDPDFSNVNDASIAQMASRDYWIIILSTTLLVPVTEELLFRGVLFAGLYNRSPLAAYILSVLFFCAIHVVGYIDRYSPLTLGLCLLQYIAPSLCLCWAYAKSDSFLTPVIIHTVANFLGVLSL